MRHDPGTLFLPHFNSPMPHGSLGYTMRLASLLAVALSLVRPISAVCGNGIIEAGEACDDGNTRYGDGCNSQCAIGVNWHCHGEPSKCYRCGNAIKDPYEKCDDGNNNMGDGCSPTCTVATNWHCHGGAGMRSKCYKCGNGIIDPHEGCDDGNTKWGDGCTRGKCLVEDGWTCTGVPSVCLTRASPAPTSRPTATPTTQPSKAPPTVLPTSRQPTRAPTPKPTATTKDLGYVVLDAVNCSLELHMSLVAESGEAFVSLVHIAALDGEGQVWLRSDGSTTKVCHNPRGYPSVCYSVSYDALGKPVVSRILRRQLSSGSGDAGTVEPTAPAFGNLSLLNGVNLSTLLPSTQAAQAALTAALPLAGPRMHMPSDSGAARRGLAVVETESCSNCKEAMKWLCRAGVAADCVLIAETLGKPVPVQAKVALAVGCLALEQMCENYSPERLETICTAIGFCEPAPCSVRWAADPRGKATKCVIYPSTSIYFVLTDECIYTDQQFIDTRYCEQEGTDFLTCQDNYDRFSCDNACHNDDKERLAAYQYGCVPEMDYYKQGYCLRDCLAKFPHCYCLVPGSMRDGGCFNREQVCSR
ncbi:unnamed protein product [Phaeothamnion confervicola]